jgi:hypothetical protein
MLRMLVNALRMTLLYFPGSSLQGLPIKDIASRIVNIANRNARAAAATRFARTEPLAGPEP